MGKRLLRSWLLRPSIDMAEINARLDAVEAQVKETIAREELRRALDGILDLERLLSRVTLETANPRDVLALAASLAKLPAVRKALERVGSSATHVAAADSAAQASPEAQANESSPNRLTKLHTSVDELTDLRQRIESTIIPEPPISLSDGGVIQPGADQELDQLRDLSRNSKQFLAQIEQRERQRTGIASLKVKFNSIFGYYLEISRGEFAPGPARLRTQANSGQCGALHHPGVEGIRIQNPRRPGKDRRHRTPAVRRVTLSDRRRSPPHSPDRAGSG